MNKGAKIAIIGGVLAAGTFLASKALKYKTIKDQLTIDLVGFRVHGFVGNITQIFKFAVKLAIDIKFINPTPHDIKLAIPSVKIFFDSVQIGQTVPNLQETNIKGGEITTINNIIVEVPVKKLIGLGIGRAIFDTQNEQSIVEALAPRVSFQVYAKVNGIDLTLNESLAGLGQLGITAGPRNIKDGTEYNHLFPQAKQGKKVMKPDGNVDNVVESMIDIVEKYSHQVKKLAKELEADSVYRTCGNIFDFAYNHMQYQRDSAGIEELRTPARAWYDGQIRYKQQGDKSAGIDCDDYAMFVGSILHQLNIPFKFRITKYNGRSYYQHVYVTVPHDGKEIIIDPVLDKFNYEKPFSEEKSNFDMGQLFGDAPNLSGFISGISNEAELLSIANGSDFEELDGLGSTDNEFKAFEKGVYNNLVKTLNQVKSNPEIFAEIQNPAQLQSMLEQAVKYYYTDKRDQVISKLADIEEKLEKEGLINLAGLHDTAGIDLEIEDFEEDWNPVSGVPMGAAQVDTNVYFDGRNYYADYNGQTYTTTIEGLGGFFKKMKKGFKHAKKKTKKGLKKFGKALVRYNPATAAVRLAVLKGIQINIFKLANKLAIGYMTLEEAKAWGLSEAQWRKNQKALNMILRVFKKIGGREGKFKTAIRKGNKKNKKFRNPAKPKQLGEPVTLSVGAKVGISAGMAVLELIADILMKNMETKSQKQVQMAQMQQSADVKKMEIASNERIEMNRPAGWSNKKKLMVAGAGIAILGAAAFGIYKMKANDSRS